MDVCVCVCVCIYIYIYDVDVLDVLQAVGLDKKINLNL